MCTYIHCTDLYLYIKCVNKHIQNFVYGELLYGKILHSNTAYLHKFAFENQKWRGWNFLVLMMS